MTDLTSRRQGPGSAFSPAFHVIPIWHALGGHVSGAILPVRTEHLSQRVVWKLVCSTNIPNGLWTIYILKTVPGHLCQLSQLQCIKLCITKSTCHSAGPHWGVCVKTCWWEAGPHRSSSSASHCQPAVCPAIFLPCGMGFAVPSSWSDRFRSLLGTGSWGRLLKGWLSPNTNQVGDKECTVLGSIQQRLRQLRSGVGKDTFVKDRGLWKATRLQ